MKRIIPMFIALLVLTSFSPALAKTDTFTEDFNLLLKAGDAFDNGNYDDAILIAGTIIKKKGVDSTNLASAYITIGSSYKQKQMFSEAIEAFQKVQTMINSDSAFIPLAHKCLGRTYVDMKIYPKAISEFEKAISILNKKKRDEMKKGRSYYDRILGAGTFQSNIDSYDVDLADNLLLLANAYVGSVITPEGTDDDLIQIPKEAISAKKKILEIKPYSPDVFEKVQFLTSKEDSNDIIVWCEKLIKRYPNNSKLYSTRGRRYAVLENYQQSIKDFSKAIELDPQNLEAYRFRGGVFSIIGNNEMAVKDYDSAIAINPSEAALYYFRGRANLNSITIMKDGRPHYQKKNEEQVGQAFKDIRIAARLGDKDAQGYLREHGATW